MLIFHRPSFRSGIMVLKDRHKDGREFKFIVKANQNGGEVDLEDPKFAQAQCPFLITPEQYQSAVQADREAKDAKKSRVF
jgi:hypothetical protein